MFREMVIANEIMTAQVSSGITKYRANLPKRKQIGSRRRGPCVKKPEESWLAVHSHVYLIARGNLMSRTKCTLKLAREPTGG